MALIEKNRAELIRDMEPMQARKQLLLMLPQLAKAYGAYESIPDYVYEKALEAILKSFKHLSLADIEEAYEMTTTGKIEAPDTKIYAGVFNVKNLGATLREYTKIRKNIIASLEKENDNIMNDQSDEQHATKKKEEYEKNFLGILDEAASKYSSFLDVPPHLYESAIRLGHYDAKTEEAIAAKKDAWQRSELFAISEISGEALKLKGSGRPNDAKALFQPDNVQGKRISLAQKIIIFEQILKPYRSTDSTDDD